eukprot:TRINITY_DN14358_c0_g1_i2.p1 TRINITY_DN14358_c0_g1~~TRINITY_DN14358_c0_g1_i2.p1  ORF type:complete len:447 (-),score=134.74 TRINITY_DN14358_c0_g1_i2:35-1375(-)
MVARQPDPEALETRLQLLESDLRRTREEVEACSVLLLSLDASSNGGGGGRVGAAGLGSAQVREDAAAVGGGGAEAARLEARLDVLEQAWTLRSATLAQHAEGSIAQLEEEVKRIWAQLEGRSEILASTEDLAKSLQKELQGSLEGFRAELASIGTQVKELHGLRPEAMDQLVKKMSDEMARSVGLLSDRTAVLEKGLAPLQAKEAALEADRQRHDEIERLMEQLVQQRRTDLQEAEANFREVDARFRELDQRQGKDGGPWSKEVDVLRKELADLQGIEVPSVFRQSTKAMKSLQDGLTAVRAEVLKLSEQVEALARKPVEKRLEEQRAAEQVLALRAELGDLHEQVTRLLATGLEERMANLRADVSKEVGQALREGKESWAAASRRLAALEVWSSGRADLDAELKNLRVEQQEDHTKLSLLARENEGLGRQVAHLSKEASVAHLGT